MTGRYSLNVVDIGKSKNFYINLGFVQIGGEESQTIAVNTGQY